MIDDWQGAMFWLHLFELVVVALIGVFTWRAGRHRATTKAIEEVRSESSTAMSEMEDRMDSVEDRVLVIEKIAEHAPTHRDLADIHSRITAVSNQMNTMAGKVSSIDSSVKLIHQHLLKSQ